MKRNYIFCVLLILGMFVTGFTEISLSQTRKRTTNSSAKRAATTNKTSSKRAATTGKTSAKRVATSSTSTKRAATSSTSAKRAATSSSSTKRAATSSASTKRAMSRSVARKTAVKTTTVEEPKNINYCPVGTVIKKVLDDDGNETYYSAKTTTCVVDENMDVMKWNEASRESYPLSMYQISSWIGKDNAYYLVCKSGYVEDKVDGKATCVPYLDICPLNEVITKVGDDYIHPGKTAEIENTCRPLNNARLRQLSKTEYNANPDYNYNYAYDDINIFECPENSYSESTNYPGLADTCKPCPYMIDGERVYASKGSTEKEACRPVCRENGIPVKKVSVKVGNAYVCKPCDEQGATFSNNLCQTKSGYTCYENGTRCEKTLQASDCTENASLIDNKCVCDEGYIGDNGLKTGSGCHKVCGENATMNMNDYSCSCNEGYDGDGYTCKYNPAPAGLTENDCVEGATFEDGKCVCPDGSFGDGLKDNSTSPYCKYFSKIASDAVCKNTYNALNGKGTQIPRGCVANCLTGYYWGEN